jgi:hypothetical protein
MAAGYSVTLSQQLTMKRAVLTNTGRVIVTCKDDRNVRLVY